MSDNRPTASEQPGGATGVLVAVVKRARQFYDWATPLGAASAVATLAVLIDTLLGETTASLIDSYRNFPALAAVEPWWTRAVLFVPLPVWWVLTIVFAAGLWLYCRRRAEDHGALWFFLPPVLLFVLPYVVGWALYTQVRTLT